MAEADPSSRDGRVLILAPTAKDASLARSILGRIQIACECCANLEQVCQELDKGAAAVLLAEEAVEHPPSRRLRAWLQRQPSWSDLPVLILAQSGADSATVAEAMEVLGNVVVLERPTRVTALVSAVRTALRSRERQYQAREQLAQIVRSENDLRDFFDNASVGLHWVGPDGLVLRVNQAELDFLGYRREEYVGRHIAEFHVDPDEIQNLLARLARGETVREYPTQMRAKNGAIREVLIDSNVLFEDGKFIHTRCFTRDITELKRARDDQRLLASIVESSDDAIVGKSLDGVIRSWNAGAERVFGYTAKQAIGQHVSFIIPPERASEEDLILAKIRAGTPVDHFETVRVRSDGRLIPVALTISPTRDAAGWIVGASKIARDITGRKHAEEMSLRAADRLRLLWESAVVLLTADDPDSMLTRLFDRIGPHLGIEAYFNLMVDETGKGLRLVSYAGVEEAEAQRVTRVEFGRAVSGKVALERRPIVMTHILRSEDPDTELARTWGIRAAACYPLLAGQRLLGTLSFASRSRDEFHADEREFMQIICQYVSAAYERLSLIARLQDADRRKDEFLAVLAHELRNPLAPIRNSLHILRLTSQHDPAADRVGEMVERQVNHMVRLVDDLLEVSRITRGKIELRKEQIEVAAVVRSAVETSRPLIEAAGHQLALAIPTEPLILEGDPVRLAQVLSNLLNNAAKYTDAGGQIWLTVRREGEGVAISVRDTGMGIPPNMLPRVFEMFAQIERNAERSQGGLGIGLTLVKSLVEMHGGSVKAHSDGPGQGSEFVIRLPLVAAQHAVDLSQAEPAPSSTPLSPRRILVVDDNRDAADSLGVLLKLLGAEVHIVYSGPDALEALAAHKPAVVLLDIGMPGMDGREVARRIRQQPEFQDVTLIALTGWGQEEDRRRSQSAGFDYHLIKPADFNVLETLLMSLEEGAGGRGKKR